MAGTEIGLGVDVRGIHVISLAARLRVETRSGTPADGPANIQGARSSTLATLHALSTEWDDTMLHRSMAYAAMSAHDFANRLNRSSAGYNASPHIKWKLRQPHCCVNMNSSERLRHVRRTSSGHLASIVLHRYWWPSAKRAAPPTQDWSLGSSAFHVTVSALRVGSTRTLTTAIGSVDSLLICT